MVRQLFFLISFALIAAISLSAIFFNPMHWWWFVIVGPLVIIGILDISQSRQAIRRNFPVIGNFRYILEEIRPEIMQYFVETDT